MEAADLNALLREVDASCERRDWGGLQLLAGMCRRAAERGKQLWPIAEHIQYRLVLEGPPEIAGPLVLPGAGRFSPGPFAEVAASTHTFAELAGHLPAAQARESVGAERVLRGEDLSGDPRAHPPVLELPLKLLPGEPPYRLATYRSDHVEVQEPSLPALSDIPTPGPGVPLGETELEEALLDLVRPWFEESGGRADAIVVEGNARQAIGWLEVGEVAAAEVSFSSALELMAWAAASGGSFGRRRGAAFGRFAAWWATAEMCDLPWPPDPEVFQREGEMLSWVVFEPRAEEPSGWRLSIACESEEEGWGCAIHARDIPPDLP